MGANPTGASTNGHTTVGVSELRQNLSVYLRLVAAGEAFEVTERGQPVAMLGPLPEQGDTFDRLVARGLARPAKGDLLDLGMPRPLKRRDKGVSISDALREQRAERL